eukprot:1806453-Pyramimonas_sp.AAC.1
MCIIATSGGRVTVPASSVAESLTSFSRPGSPSLPLAEISIGRPVTASGGRKARPMSGAETQTQRAQSGRVRSTSAAGKLYPQRTIKPLFSHSTPGKFSSPSKCSEAQSGRVRSSSAAPTAMGK